MTHASLRSTAAFLLRFATRAFAQPPQPTATTAVRDMRKIELGMSLQF